MKKLLTIVILINAWVGSSQDLKTLDNKDGFREFHFTDHISKYPNLKSFDRTPDSNFIFYRKNNEDLIINGGAVDIVYTFYKDELATILITTNDSISSRKVLQSFQNQYGNGKKEDPYVEKYIWYGRKILLSYYEDMNKFTARIYISSIKMKLKAEGRDY